ncbi:putative polysaccharide biosynthesis protein [Brevibacillus fulvus]|uniref:PST family polysaccharide transporter n=1 Tax=Brevibacillus fulvus TaxID=1125967 RepID=A0A938XYR5_9BACL|nr:polysaccharide biosynthesis protein [Brevibacillus fulvus]MBM7590098.1 PST family polysaccharide transporter [Brevibacillus fulvus]
MLKKSHFLGGAIILTIAGFLSKIIGMFYRIPLQDIVGDSGLGLYQEVYPLYLAFLNLATAGVPIALSRIIAEALAEGNTGKVQQILARSLLLMSVIGTALFSLLYFSSPLIALAMGNLHLVEPIRAISLSLLFVPLIAVLRGYFYGCQKMMVVGLSQVVEQTLRVVLIMLTAGYLVKLGEDTDSVIAGVNFGTMISTVISLLFLFLLLGWQQRSSRLTLDPRWKDWRWWIDRRFFLNMWKISWPICVGALAIPIFSLVDSFLAINIFRYVWRVDGVTADAWFGVYSRGGPLLQLASLFGASIALSIVPAIAEAKRKHDEDRVRTLSRISFRFAWLLGLPAGLGLTGIAEGANLALYGDLEGTRAMAILAVSAIPLSMLLATNGVLQGLGKENVPALHLLWGVGVKIVTTLVFASLFGIDGLSLSWLAASTFVWLLNMRSIRKLVKSEQNWAFDYIYPLIAANVMLLCTWTATIGCQYWLHGISARLLGAAETVIGIAVGMIVYIGLLVAIPLLEPRELDWLPGGNVVRKFAGFLRKRRTEQ